VHTGNVNEWPGDGNDPPTAAPPATSADKNRSAQV
jgi:PiT family inorganic phosphate transporter